MKILFINDKGYAKGGSQIYLFQIAELLKKRGHNILIVSSSRTEDMKILSDVQYKYFPPKTILKIINNFFNSWAYITTKNTLKNFKPDIIHYNYILNQASPSVIFAGAIPIHPR